MPPAGFKRSRALWDDARRPRDRKLDEWRALLRAIVYELQPIRLSEYEHLWRTANLLSVLDQRVWPLLRQLGTLVTSTIPETMWSTVWSMTLRQWSWVVGIILYCFVVRWIHELLHAGPLMLIITALVAVFTIGLGERAEGELSAYSVFNRGFQRLMGSIDIDELVNQHVGGGILNMAPRPEADDDDNLRRRNAAAAAAPLVEEDDGSDEEDDNLQNNNAANDNNTRGARRSGKKSRRRDLEERRELQRQREAARAMGFDGTGGPEEMMAMQRLIEAQVARDHHHGQ